MLQRMRSRAAWTTLLAALLAVLFQGPVRGQIPTELKQAVDAHGGLDTWEAYGTVEYDFSLQIGNATRDDHHIFDLNTRRVRVEDESYTVGITESKAWVAADMDAYGYADPPRFYGKPYTYLFSIPFVFADPGVRVESAGQRSLQGTSYDILEITFDEGVGDTPRDVFYLYLEPASHQARAALFSVTYRNPEVTRPITGVVYNEWATVDGVTVPHRATMYGISDDLSLSKKLGSFAYRNVTFGATSPSRDQFVMPNRAVRDTSLQARTDR